MDSMSVSSIPLPGGYYPTEVWIQQKQRGPSQPYHNVPVTLTFMDVLGNLWTHPLPVMVGGTTCTVGSAPPFVPKWAIINNDERIALATTGSTDLVTSGGFHAFSQANVDVTFPTLSDIVQARVEQFWVAADNSEVNEAFAYIISPDRYWRMVGNIPAGTTARIFYDGRNTTAGTLDPLLLRDTLGFTFREDSLVMLYRAEPWQPWSEAYTTVNTLGSATDGYGRITIDSLWAGEYTLAWRKSAVGVREVVAAETQWTIAPNPARQYVVVSTASVDMHGTMQLLDSTGRTIATERVANGSARFDLHDVQAGTYQLKYSGADGTAQRVGSVVVQ